MKPAAAAASTASAAAPVETEKVFTAMYCKRSNKKHKTFEDAVLVLLGRRATLKNMENKQIGTTILSFSTAGFGQGSELSVGGWDVEIVAPVPLEEFQSGRIFLGSVSSASGISTSRLPNW